MDSEWIKIFDEQRTLIGTASRQEAHQKGYWHETFHCWFLRGDRGKEEIYLSLRSKTKLDFPYLFDITAAGHLFMNEKPSEGIREIKEETGIDLVYDDLISLGIIQNRIENEMIIDCEFSHTYLFKGDVDFNDFSLQKEEVAGMVKADFQDFCKFCRGECKQLTVSGFENADTGKQVWFTRKIGTDEMVPHSQQYLFELTDALERAVKV